MALYARYLPHPFQAGRTSENAKNTGQNGICLSPCPHGRRRAVLIGETRLLEFGLARSKNAKSFEKTAPSFGAIGPKTVKTRRCAPHHQLPPSAALRGARPPKRASYVASSNRKSAYFFLPERTAKGGKLEPNCLSRSGGISTLAPRPPLAQFSRWFFDKVVAGA